MGGVARLRALMVGALAAGTVLGLAACGSPGSTAEPTWTPKPTFSGEGYAPGGGQSTAPPNPDSPGLPSNGQNGRRSNRNRGPDPSVVATRLTAPTGLTILPDNTALVGERTTGRILRVQPQPGHPARLVRTLTGLSTVGGGGLLDLAISPNYAQDNLIFAYITTPQDNRVVAFTLHGPVTTVFAGIPRGRTDNTGRIAFDASGNLLIGTGDAGHPAWADAPNNLAGKVLRVTDIGRPARGNPDRSSPIFASGFRRTDGLCIDTHGDHVLQTEAMPNRSGDPVNLVTGASRFAWPAHRPSVTAPLAELPHDARSPGGCAVLGSVLFTTSLDGQSLLAAQLHLLPSGAPDLTAFTKALHKRYGRLHTVVAAPDGALWLTTSNRDGKGNPIAADERVIRIVPTGGGGSEDRV